MTRLVSLVLLGGLVLPYARMPACATAGHEHADDSAMPAGLAAGHHSEAGGNPADCHRLMACGTTLQGVVALEDVSSVPAPRLAVTATPVSVPRDGPPREPLSPPPQSV